MDIALGYYGMLTVKSYNYVHSNYVNKSQIHSNHKHNKKL